MIEIEIQHDYGSGVSEVGSCSAENAEGAVLGARTLIREYLDYNRAASRSRLTAVFYVEGRVVRTVNGKELV